MWKGLLLAGGIPTVIAIVTYFLSNRKTKDFGIGIGKFISRVLRQKAGKAGEKVGEKTLETLMDGIKIGMALDNDRIIIKQEKKIKKAEVKKDLLSRLKNIVT